MEEKKNVSRPLLSLFWKDAQQMFQMLAFYWSQSNTNAGKKLELSKMFWSTTFVHMLHNVYWEHTGTVSVVGKNHWLLDRRINTT